MDEDTHTHTQTQHNNTVSRFPLPTVLVSTTTASTTTVSTSTMRTCSREHHHCVERTVSRHLKKRQRARQQQRLRQRSSSMTIFVAVASFLFVAPAHETVAFVPVVSRKQSILRTARTTTTTTTSKTTLPQQQQQQQQQESRGSLETTRLFYREGKTFVTAKQEEAIQSTVTMPSMATTGDNNNKSTTPSIRSSIVQVQSWQDFDATVLQEHNAIVLVRFLAAWCPVSTTATAATTMTL